MRIYYFNSTHWDREWYLPFQVFRIKLFSVIEQILSNLESVPDYEHFTFDGQTIILEDITEIPPDLSDRLKRQISTGRLNVGPWYVMPDEFLVSGESLIRNLLIGHSIAKEYGHTAWKSGYLCDIFGHIAQLPQLLKGFGINIAIAARGIDAELPQLLR
jgi:mannosylglycerate hydrolase